MYIDISKLDHAAVMERTWEEWRAIFSLEEKAYGMKLKGYRGKQRLVYLPDFICRVEGFNPDCAIICHKRVFDKFGPNIKLNSAVAYLKEPDRFPGDYSKAPRNYIKQERDLVLQRIISTNDVEALAAFIEFMGKTTDLKNLDIIIAAAEESHDIRNYALELKNKLYSPNDIDKLYMIQEEKDLGLRELTVEDCKKNWSYKKRDDGSLCLTLYKGEDKDIVIPVKIGKSFVSEIGDHVILPANRYYNPKYQERRLLVRSVLIPEGIKRIGIEAFAECKNLVNVTFPDSLTEIGAGAFRGCDGLKDPDGRLIVGGVLYRYESDEEHVVIPDNIRQIDNEVFKNRRNLKAVTLPESICSIGDEAFYGCTALMTINLPEGLRHIGASAFQGCPGW